MAYWAAVYYIDGFWSAYKFYDGYLESFIITVYSILDGLNWRNNYCTKYFHYLLMFPISWIIDIDSASVSSTHTALIHRAIK